MVRPVDMASYLVSCGIPCVALSEGGKEPFTPDGVYNSTLSQDQVNSWWSKNPHFNIGIPLGDLSEKIVRKLDENGKYVVDDSYHYVKETVSWFSEDEYTPLVVVDDDSPKYNNIKSCIDIFEEETGVNFHRNTLNWISGNGGHSYMFSDPNGVFPRQRFIGDHLKCDVLGKGYTVFPPSRVFPAKETGTGFYTLSDNAALMIAGDTEAAFIDWYKKNYKEPRATTIRGCISEGVGNYIWPAEIINGSRNTELLSVCRSLCAKGFSEEFIAGAMESINEALCSEPVPDHELERICDNAFRYGVNDTEWLKRAETEVDALKYFAFFLLKKECNADLIHSLCCLFNEEHLDIENEDVPRILNSYFKCLNRRDLCI